MSMQAYQTCKTARSLPPVQPLRGCTSLCSRPTLVSV
uniref:Uncharacterized protein n=1 Tax=Anguilla anguilla TaxID=7936 RepID=A0A0E9ULM7_ANGAN